MASSQITDFIVAKLCSFREPSTEFQSAIQKEKGDWKNLSVEDKKKLYRYNYCETFSEMLAPTGVWKSITAIVIFWMTLATWAYITMKKGKNFFTMRFEIFMSGYVNEQSSLLLSVWTSPRNI